jgi:TolB-like protein
MCSSVTKKIIFIVSIFSFLSVNAQKKVFMPWFETINLKADFKVSTTKLLKGYMENTGKYQVLNQSANDTMVYNMDEIETAKTAAKDKNAQYLVMGTLNRLGEMVIVNIQMFDVNTGTKVWFDQLKALTPDDLDPILQRVGQNIGSEFKATTTDDIYSVTNQETQELKKKESNNSFGIGINGITLMGNQSSSSPLAGISLNWSFDARDYIFDIKPFWTANKERNLIGISLEMNKPFHSKGNTPFLGGGVSFSRTDIEYSSPVTTTSLETSGYGLMLIAGGGYIFNRTGSTSVRVSANYMQGFYDVTSGSNYSYARNSRNDGYTYGILFRVEILFRR